MFRPTLLNISLPQNTIIRVFPAINNGTQTVSPSNLPCRSVFLRTLFILKSFFFGQRNTLITRDSIAVRRPFYFFNQVKFLHKII